MDPANALKYAYKYYVVLELDFSVSEVDNYIVCNLLYDGQIMALKKQPYDKFSLLSGEELLTLLSGSCIPYYWNFNAKVCWLSTMPGRVPD